MVLVDPCQVERHPAMVLIRVWRLPLPVSHPGNVHADDLEIIPSQRVPLLQLVCVPQKVDDVPPRLDEVQVISLLDGRAIPPVQVF